MESNEIPGVENPKIIDMIAKDPQSGEVVLSIYERRTWPQDEKLAHSRIVQWQNKIDSYVSYVVDGFLKQQYPSYAPLPVRIDLLCLEKPTGIFADFVKTAEDFASTYQIVLNCRDGSILEIEHYFKNYPINS